MPRTDANLREALEGVVGADAEPLQLAGGVELTKPGHAEMGDGIWRARGDGRVVALRLDRFRDSAELRSRLARLFEGVDAR